MAKQDDDRPPAKPAEAREQRLAKALRDNLRRRKAAPGESANRDPAESPGESTGDED